MTDSEQKKASTGAKLAIDLGPLLVFFLVNGFAPVPDMLRIFWATGAFMAAMIVAMIVSQIRYKHISPMLWFSGIMVLNLGIGLYTPPIGTTLFIQYFFVTLMRVPLARGWLGYVL